MHLLAGCRRGADDGAAAGAAREQGVRVVPLSRQYLGAPGGSGLVLGYAAVPPDEIREGVRGLARALTAR